jgi:hypothetical protein|tara:strand:+ start:647 stop:853 length:207 start_codon:yes stop_codon:yes gene_type:complete
MNEKSKLFLKWFNDLSDDDQSEAIDLVYDEFNVRVIVEGFAKLTKEQRNDLFKRLGIPGDIQENLSGD